MEDYIKATPKVTVGAEEAWVMVPVVRLRWVGDKILPLSISEVRRNAEKIVEDILRHVDCNAGRPHIRIIERESCDFCEHFVKVTEHGIAYCCSKAEEYSTKQFLELNTEWTLHENNEVVRKVDESK